MRYFPLLIVAGIILYFVSQKKKVFAGTTYADNQSAENDAALARGKSELGDYPDHPAIDARGNPAYDDNGNQMGVA